LKETQHSSLLAQNIHRIARIIPCYANHLFPVQATDDLHEDLIGCYFRQTHSLEGTVHFHMHKRTKAT